MEFLLTPLRWVFVTLGFFCQAAWVCFRAGQSQFDTYLKSRTTTPNDIDVTEKSSAGTQVRGRVFSAKTN